MPPRSFWLALALLGLLLTATVIPGVFTIDEDNYLVQVTGLWEGRLTVPGTEDLPPSSELVWFDPRGASREVTETPVASSAPPLYAFLALPFSLLGWRGLVFLNVLGYLAATALVFLYGHRYATHTWTPWIAAAAFALGSYTLEYAQGMWPQMVSLGLTTGAVYLAARVRDGAALAWAAAAGLLAGLATGVRYQNVFFAACVGFGIFLFTERRFRTSFAYGAGLLVPVAAISGLNRLRLGFWNPISKGPGYLSTGGAHEGDSFLGDFVTMAWARIVDYSTRPPLPGTEFASYMQPDPVTGAYLLGPTLKKAWLQSAPWIALALGALIVAWGSWARNRRHMDPDPETGARRRELLALSLVVLPTLAMFSATGLHRTDGFGFNQRYFLELVPLVAVAFAWGLERARGGAIRTGVWILGGLAGVLAAGGVLLLLEPEAVLRQQWLLYLPLALAVLLVAVWIGARRFHVLETVTALLAATALGWGFAAHVGDDLATSRILRRISLERAQALDRAIPQDAPEGSALFAFWGNKDPVGPLLLDRDLVVLDVRNDRGEHALELMDALLAQGRRVFVLATGFPPLGLEVLLAGRSYRVVVEEPVTVIEVRGRDEPGAESARLHVVPRQRGAPEQVARRRAAQDRVQVLRCQAVGGTDGAHVLRRQDLPPGHVLDHEQGAAEDAARRFFLADLVAHRAQGRLHRAHRLDHPPKLLRL